MSRAPTATAFVAAVALIIAAAPRAVGAQSAPRPAVRDSLPAGSGATLRDRLGLSARELDRVDRGEVVTRVLADATAEEAALVGVVRLAVSPAEFARRFATLGPEVRSPRATQFGAFSTRPAREDLARYVLPDADVEPLRACAVGDCKLKLPRDAIARLRDLRPSASADRVATLVRAWLLEYARGYQDRGNAALVVYDDARRPLALHEGFHALLAEPPSLAESMPELHHYLDEFPARPLAGVEDRLYWSVEEFGLRPLTTITHAVIYARPAGRAPRVLIALKQVYASHYFHAGLATLMLFEAPAAGGASGGGESSSGSYLVWLDRSLFDTDLGGFTRRRVVGRLEANLAARLGALRQPPGRATP